MCSRVLIITISLIYYFNEIYCEELFDLNCKTNVDCEQFKLPGYNVTCLNYKCICNNNNGLQVKCESKNENTFNLIGKPCPCHIENSTCDPYHDICLCSSNFTTSSDKLRCIKRTVTLNGSCEDNSQCILHDNFSVCDNNVCKCQENYINHNGICVSTVGLGEKCQNDNQCNNKTENSFCSSDGLCVCTRDFVANEKKTICLKSAGYSESCIITEQCQHKLGPGSECYSGNCTCDAQHYLIVENKNNRKKYLCERYIVLGDHCREHTDCYQYHLQQHEQTMVCYLRECICRDGFESDTTNRICLSNGSTKLSYVSLSIFILLLKFF